jgi:solute carrier family 7 (L-type amino acid transporter), member 9/15
MPRETQSDDSARQPLLADQEAEEYGVAVAAIAASAKQYGTFVSNLGTREAFAIVISIVIGSGVFTSPGSVDTNVPSPGAALVVWLVGGGLAWTGASTMAELGTAISGEG